MDKVQGVNGQATFSIGTLLPPATSELHSHRKIQSNGFKATLPKPFIDNLGKSTRITQTNR